MKLKLHHPEIGEGELTIGSAGLPVILVCDDVGVDHEHDPVDIVGGWHVDEPVVGVTLALLLAARDQGFGIASGQL